MGSPKSPEHRAKIAAALRIIKPHSMQRQIQSFWGRVEKTSSCWNWKGHIDKDGYGYFRRGGAHRFAVKVIGGRVIPYGMQVDHLCRNRRCVNPDHLDIVSSRENTLRGESIQAKNSRKSHCFRGHPFSSDNTYVDRRGSRVCRVCAAIAREKSKTVKE